MITTLTYMFHMAGHFYLFMCEENFLKFLSNFFNLTPTAVYFTSECVSKIFLEKKRLLKLKRSEKISL